MPFGPSTRSTAASGARAASSSLAAPTAEPAYRLLRSDRRVRRSNGCGAGGDTDGKGCRERDPVLGLPRNIDDALGGDLRLLTLSTRHRSPLARLPRLGAAAAPGRSARLRRLLRSASRMETGASSTMDWTRSRATSRPAPSPLRNQAAPD